jgi:hypothetical protein
MAANLRKLMQKLCGMGKTPTDLAGTNAKPLGWDAFITLNKRVCG